jgi:hypothetical protein
MMFDIVSSRLLPGRSGIDCVVVKHAGKAGRIAAWAHIGAAADAGRANDHKRRVGKEVATVGIESVELLEDGQFHRLLVEPAQRCFIAHRICAYYGPIVHWTSPRSRTPKLKEGERKTQRTPQWRERKKANRALGA